MTTQSPSKPDRQESATGVLPYETSAPRRTRVVAAACAVLAMVAVLAAFPLGVAVSILMESRSGGLFTTHQGEHGGFAVFACGEALAAAAGWFALSNAKRANSAKWTRAVATAGGMLGCIGAIIALLILLRGGVP